MAFKTKQQPGEYFLDAVGRRRKLSAGAMQDIRMSYYNGETTRELAKQYNVSVSLILTVVYNTPRERDLKRLDLPASPPVMAS